ncbi:MAG: hypothetical protein GY851_34155 [bacterium]|nr:hypothetical protein [bacterium]
MANEANPAVDPGLCASCACARRIRHPRGGADYWRCGRHDEDKVFPKYPRLPVRDCTGFKEADGADTS